MDGAGVCFDTVMDFWTDMEQTQFEVFFSEIILVKLDFFRSDFSQAWL